MYTGHCNQYYHGPHMAVVAALPSPMDFFFLNDAEKILISGSKVKLPNVGIGSGWLKGSDENSASPFLRLPNQSSSFVASIPAFHSYHFISQGFTGFVESTRSWANHSSVATESHRALSPSSLLPPSVPKWPEHFPGRGNKFTIILRRKFCRNLPS